MGDSQESEPRPGQSLEDAALDEREVARRGAREELGREPSDEEVDDYLRRHTEGY